MLGIFRKDCLHFALAGLVAFPAVLLVENAILTELTPAWVVINMALAALLAFEPLFATEIEEEHGNGYALLGSLPVLPREVVAAKFLLFLAAVAACTAAQFVFLAVAQASPSLLAAARSASLFAGAACLVLGGVFYAAIFSFGCVRSLNVWLTVSLACCVAATILLGNPAGRELLRKAAGVFLQLSAQRVVLGGLALYALLFFVSVALFRFEPGKKALPLF